MIGNGIDGRHRILSYIARGGMGEVYLAEHIRLGHKEAFKVLNANMVDRPKLASRFRREAKAALRLTHRNIATLLDFGELEDGRLFLVTEYAEGETLQDIVREEGSLEFGRALRYRTRTSTWRSAARASRSAPSGRGAGARAPDRRDSRSRAPARA